MGIVSKSQSGRACAQPASRPSAPRSGGGAKRRALTPVSTRARCWLDDAASDHNILRSAGVAFPSDPRARQQPVLAVDNGSVRLARSHVHTGFTERLPPGKQTAPDRGWRSRVGGIVGVPGAS